MAGLIAGADIMSGGRTPHPYHTRPGMVSRSHDGDPHGKPPAPAPGRERSPRYPRVRGNRFAKRAASAAMPDRHLVTLSD
jgi:hypothetical protein